MATPYKYYIIEQTDLENGALDTRYYTRNQVTTLLNGYVGKITGKSLSTNDYTTSEKNKLAGIEAGAEVNNLSDAQVLDLTDGNETTLHKHNATNTPFTPTGELSSTNVQTALAELDTEKASKLFATNLVTNGDFSNGTTGWGSGGSSLTTSSNVLSVTSSGTTTYPYAIQYGSNATVGDKYYFRYSAKVNSSSCLYLQYRMYGLTAATTSIITPAQNTWYSFSIVRAATDTTNSIVLYHNYVDNATSSGKIMEVKNVLSINLTAIFGAGNEPTKEQMDWIFTERDRLGLGYLNGTAELLPMVSLLNLINKKANIAQEDWITPTLLNGWTPDPSVPPAYYKNNFGEVRLRGRFLTGTIGSPIFTLPTGYRPQNTVRISIYNGNVYGNCTINTNGFVTVWVGNAVDIQLDNINFRAV